MRDAGNRLAERGHFLGLQHLVAAVAVLIFTLLPLADVAHQCLDEERVAGRRIAGRGGDFDPDRRAVHAPYSYHVIGDLAVAIEELDERLTSLRIDEARGIKGKDDGLGGIRRIAEDLLEM